MATPDRATPPSARGEASQNPAHERPVVERDATDVDLAQARENWQRHWEERRSQQRYPLDNPFSCNLELDSGHYPAMPVQLMDISQGGACLLISSLVELRRGEMGELRTPLRAGGAVDPLHRRRLRVCWQEAREWITAVGVAFEPPLESLPLQLDVR